MTIGSASALLGVPGPFS